MLRLNIKKGEYGTPGFKTKNPIGQKGNYLGADLKGVSSHNQGAIWHRTGTDELYTIIMVSHTIWYTENSNVVVTI